ncbi:MAG: biotin/lipoyl-binding protein, partial [Patescibacteria group bacterium]
MRKVASFLKQKIVLLVGAIVILGVIGAVAFGDDEPSLQTVRVERGKVVQEVSVTGIVKPVEEVSLSFERSGRVTQVRVVVGDIVTAGTVLVELDRSELAAQLTEAEAQVRTQQAKLDELQRGTRPEEIEVKRTELKKALQDLMNEYAEVPDAVNDAYAKTDDAIRAKTNQLFTNEESDAPRLSFLVDSASVESDAQTSRVAARFEM